MTPNADSGRAMSQDFTTALTYAAELHATQRRKGPAKIPYIAHLLGVASLVLEHGGTETQAIAALLHDAIEDHPNDGRTEREIHERFGSGVLAIVHACTDSLPDSDDRSAATWRPRKEAYLEHIPHVADEARLVSLADKLYNARAILRDLRDVGNAVWARFNVGRDDTLWYYRSLADAFLTLESLPTQQRLLAEELARTVRAMLAEAEVAR
jgi:(p)ppGpp synthase/HD superfamily hydrolase